MIVAAVPDFVVVAHLLVRAIQSGDQRDQAERSCNAMACCRVSTSIEVVFPLACYGAGPYRVGEPRASRFTPAPHRPTLVSLVLLHDADCECSKITE
jgi:hypothetical protein